MVLKKVSNFRETRNSSIGSLDQREETKSQVRRTLKNFFMGGLPLEDRNVKLTTKLKTMLKERLKKVEDSLYTSLGAKLQQVASSPLKNGQKKIFTDINSILQSTGACSIKEICEKPTLSTTSTGFNTLSYKSKLQPSSSPFSLQVSRSRANIAVFNSTAGKQGKGELNAYLGPTSGGLLTSDAGFRRSRND